MELERMEDQEKKEEPLPLTPPNQPPPHPKKLRYLTTIAILFGNITFGTAFNFYSPALEDIRSKYDTTVDDISVIFTIMLIAYCIGALSCGIIYNFVNRQLGVIICLAGMAIALYATPHCDTKTSFYIIGAILGYFVGAYDASQIVWIIEIWQEKAGPFIQAQHFCYALGSNIPPLLLAPFLMEEVDESTSNITTTQLPYEDGDSKIYIPFTIGGAFSTSACAFQLFLFIFCRYYVPPMYVDEDKEKKEEENNKEVVEAEKESAWEFIKSPRMKMIIVTGIYLGAYQGMEMCTMQFIPTFGQYSDLKMSESDAAFVLTGLTGAFAVGRFIGIFVIMKVHPLLMLAGNLILVLLGNLMLFFWANNNLTMFWIACITLGAGFSTQYPSFSGFMEKNLIFTNAIGSFMIVCGSTVAAIYPVIVGKYIEENAVILSYPVFFSLGVGSLALIWGWWMTRKNSVRN